MKTTFRSLVIMAIMMGGLATTGALAHTMVKSTTIEEGATLAASPPSVTILFDHAAGVGSVRLTTVTGETIPLNFIPPRTKVTSFTIPFPRLDPDRYKLEWRAIAQDGHVMAGGLSFGVTGGAKPAPAVAAPLQAKHP